jgi:chromosome partitioning protein
VSKASASTSQGATAGSAVPTPAKSKGTSKRKRPVVPEAPGRARIIAIANQKGGVGKSTTAVSLGAALADIGYRVLVADLDPQGNASTGMGIRHDARDVTVYDVVVSEADIERAIVPTAVERLHAIPATIDLAGAEIELVSQFSRESRLKKAIEPVSDGVYDFILLDCPPSLGLLTINALTAAEELIVPIQCEYYALEGLGQLLRNVSLVQQNINSGLRLSGIVMTMFDPRTKLSEQVVHEVQRYFGGLVYDVIIPRTVRLSEAPGFGQPITVYDTKSKGAEAYRQLAREVALRPPPEAPMPTFDDIIPAQMTVEPATVVEAEAELVIPETAGEPETVAPLTVGEEPEAVGEPGTAFDVRPGEPEGEVGEPAETSAPEANVVDVTEEPAAEAHVADLAAEPQPAESQPSADDDLWEEVQPEPEPRVKPPSRPSAPGELPERRVVVIDEHPDIDIEAGKEAAPTPPGPPEHGMADIGQTLDDDKGRKRRWRMFRKGGDR